MYSSSPAHDPQTNSTAIAAGTRTGNVSWAAAISCRKSARASFALATGRFAQNVRRLPRNASTRSPGAPSRYACRNAGLPSARSNSSTPCSHISRGVALSRSAYSGGTVAITSR